MSPLQLKNAGHQLRSAIETTLFNLSSVSTEVDMTICEKNESFHRLEYEFSAGGWKNLPVDVLQITQDVEKVMPRLKVTEAKVLLEARLIIIVAMSLGERGVYTIKLSPKSKA